jgi:MFS family permease
VPCDQGSPRSRRHLLRRSAPAGRHLDPRPLGVAAVEVASQLPWLLFALPAGALVDRWDRRRVLWLTDAYRALVLTALTVTILAGWASIPLLGAAGFLLAVGGTLFSLAHSVPFAADAFLLCASAALLASIKGHDAPARDPEHDQHQGWRRSHWTCT